MRDRGGGRRRVERRYRFKYKTGGSVDASVKKKRGGSAREFLRVGSGWGKCGAEVSGGEIYGGVGSFTGSFFERTRGAGAGAGDRVELNDGIAFKQ